MFLVSSGVQATHRHARDPLVRPEAGASLRVLFREPPSENKAPPAALPHVCHLQLKGQVN